MSNTELDLTNIDALLDAQMDDLDDLPPVGVPPSGHYNLNTTFSIETVEDQKNKGQKRQVIFAKYVVDAINELKDDSEKDEVAIGQQFREGFYLSDKDGKPNTFGIGKLKERLKLYAERFPHENLGDLIKQINQVSIATTLVRKPNPKNEDQYNMNLKDSVLL